MVRAAVREIVAAELEWLLRGFNPDLHPRYPKGHPLGGKFMKVGSADYKEAVAKTKGAAGKAAGAQKVAKKAVPSPSKTKPRSLDRVSAKEFDKAHGGIAEEKQLSTRHNSSSVYLLTYADGSKTVTKKSGNSEEFAFSEFDAEQLGALVGDALGLKAPAVHRTEDDEAYFDYIDTGQVAASVLPQTASPGIKMDVDGFFDTLDGRRIGLLDALIENPDRNQGNWIVHDDGSITPIDHGLAWERAIIEGKNGSPARPGDLGGFTGHYIGDLSGQWRSNDLSPQYVKQLRTRLAALKPQFEQLGRLDWHERLMARLDIIASHAKGDVKL